MPPKPKLVFYAVQKGRVTGVYLTWPECQTAIKGVSGAVYQKFSALGEAEAFVGLNPVAVSDGLKITKQVFATNATEEPDYYVYTDGACSNNGRPGSKAGIGIWFGPKDPRNVSEALESGATNNVAELTAILCTWPLIRADIEAGKRVAIVSDSQYAIRCAGTYGAKQAVGGWCTDIPNKVLVKSVYERYAGLERIQFLYVPAHTEGVDRHSVGNAGADRLANGAIGFETCPYADSKKSRVNLNVVYAEKEEAKRLGALWDPKGKTWYCWDNCKNMDQLKTQFS